MGWNGYFEDYVEKHIKAIMFIQHYEPPEGYYVGFSGGKDSIVTLDLVKKSGVKYQAYYSIELGIAMPEVIKFINQHYPDVIKLIPKMSFWQGCLKKNMPTIFRRWCCDVLKKKPSEIIQLKHRIFGIRAEESFRRKNRGKICAYKRNRNNERINEIHYHPIFEWSSADIWDYIHINKLPYCSLYDEGFHRLGCVVCPFLYKKNIEQHRARWPNIYRILNTYLERLWERDKIKLIDMHFTKEEFISWPLWKTKEERKQTFLNF